MFCYVIKTLRDESNSLRTDDDEHSSDADSDSPFEMPVVSWLVTYTITSAGSLRIDVSSDCSSLPTSIPRIGLQMNMRKVILS